MALGYTTSNVYDFHVMCPNCRGVHHVGESCPNCREAIARAEGKQIGGQRLCSRCGSRMSDVYNAIGEHKYSCQRCGYVEIRQECMPTTKDECYSNPEPRVEKKKEVKKEVKTTCSELVWK